MKIFSMIFITMVSGFLMYQINGCIQRENVRDVLKENLCPTAKPIDAEALKTIWALGVRTGTRMMTKTLNGDPRDANEMAEEIWPMDSIMIHNIIELSK